MIRKLAFAVALAGGMGLVSSANALGLGDVSVKSSLNQPLRAEIELVSLNGLGNEEILPGLATREEFLRAGVDRVYFLSELRFDVKKNEQGKSVVVLTTNKPVREPFLNFLVEVIWPSGRLLREYALLIDPPLFAEEPAKVVAPAPLAKPTPRVASKAPVAKSAKRTASKSSSAPRSNVAGSYGPTSRSDTLWEIALKARPDRSVSPQQMMLAIQDLNPNAFIDGNINKLKAGQVLRLPTLEQAKERSAAAAVNEVIAQNERAQGKKSKTISSAAKAQTPKQAPKTRQSGGDQLKLEVPEKPVIASSNTANSGEAEVAGSGRGGDDAKASTASPSSGELDGDALTGKVKDLEEQLATLQRLLALKNDQLATMQAQARQSEQAKAEQGADANALGDGVFAPNDAASLAEQQLAQGQEPSAQGEQTPAQGEQALGEEPSAQGEPSTAAENALAGAEGSLAGADGSLAGADGSTSQGQNAGADSQATGAEKSQMPEKAAAPAKSAGQSAPAAEQSMPEQIIRMLTNNPVYQALAAAGAVLIAILLWLLFRRKDKKDEQEAAGRNEPGLETDQFDSFEGEQGDEVVSADFADDVFADDVLDDQVEAFDAEELAAAGAVGGSFDQDDQPEQEDVIAEAEMYAAYGRLDQATAKLEGAIAEDPLRVDYRLKLLEFLADDNDREAFERQFSELEATQDQDAIAEGRKIREQMNSSISDDFDAALDSLNDGGLVETELSPSDFESLDDAAPAEAEGSFEINTELEAPELGSDLDVELDADDLGIDLTSDDLELDLDIDLDGEQALDTGLDSELESLDSDSESLSGAALGLGGAALGAAALASTNGESDEADEALEDLDLGLEIDGDNASELELESELALPDELADLDGSLELDESLELDTDAGALELDEGLELADELSLEGELLVEGGQSLEDELKPDGDASALELDADLSEQLSDELSEDLSDDGLNLDDALLAGGVAAGVAGAAAIAIDDSADSVDDIDDSILDEAQEVLAGEAPVEVNDELAEEEEFDFLNGTDEASTKLDLARAYIDMGDVDGAKDILQEVVQEGSEAQQAEAQSLLSSL